MNQIKLPIDIPPVIGFLHHAYNLTVAQQHPSFVDWFYSNYIQLRYYPQNYWLNFERLSLFGGIVDYCPLVDYQIINNDMIKNNHIDIIDFALNCIKEEVTYFWRRNLLIFRLAFMKSKIDILLKYYNQKVMFPMNSIWKMQKTY